MLKLLQKIREYTEAGIILNHMYLFDELEELITAASPPPLPYRPSSVQS